MNINEAIKNYYEIKYTQSVLEEKNLIFSASDDKAYIMVNSNDIVLEFTELEELRAFIVGLNFGYGTKTIEKEFEE